ncbi:MAG TPA: putative toxin-antitoxin system toxin component, PIN family [Candidatus Omnitrophica bacterium]|nr:putative toxin-antitoxin system toxin component, PIN family [Candidatus Omnitrophota bacterium]
MKVVFDTNVLVSAYLSSGGVLESVFKIAVTRHTTILSDYVLDEFRRILQRKLNVPDAVAEYAIQLVRKDVIILERVPLKGVHFSDKGDIPILALVKASRAHVLITGDKQLLALKRFFKAIIVSPREALEIL